jgi:hypothetical protein
MAEDSDAPVPAAWLAMHTRALWFWRALAAPGSAQPRADVPICFEPSALNPILSRERRVLLSDLKQRHEAQPDAAWAAEPVRLACQRLALVPEGILRRAIDGVPALCDALVQLTQHDGNGPAEDIGVEDLAAYRRAFVRERALADALMEGCNKFNCVYKGRIWLPGQREEARTPVTVRVKSTVLSLFNPGVYLLLLLVSALRDHRGTPMPTLQTLFRYDADLDCLVSLQRFPEGSAAEAQPVARHVALPAGYAETPDGLRIVEDVGAVATTGGARLWLADAARWTEQLIACERVADDETNVLECRE